MVMSVEFVEGGSVQLRVKRSGMYQRVVFRMVAEPSPAGKYKLLVAERQIGIHELSNLSNEVGLPIRAAGIIVFPKGKSSLDFLLK